MENLNIAEFNPLKEEITSLVESVKNTVASASGATGYELMRENKKILQSRRGDLVRDLKSKRDGAIKYQKAIIEVEKDLLKIIASVEDRLDVEIKKVDDERKREERKALLPERREKLSTIKLEMTDDELLDMDEKQFADFFFNKRGEYQDEQQKKLDKIEADRIAKEEAEARAAEIEQAKKDAAAKATKEAEEKAAQKERDRIAAEEKAAKEEKDKQERLEKRKKYVKFLEAHDCAGAKLINDQEAGNAIVVSLPDGTFHLYKKIDQITIK